MSLEAMPKSLVKELDMKKWIIKCYCGCGKTRPLLDKYGRVRTYIKGHGVYKP